MESPSYDLCSNGGTDFQDIRKRLFSETNAKQPVEVYLRIRPKSDVELMNGDESCLYQSTDKVLTAIVPKAKPESNEQFIYSKIFDNTITQKEIFEEGVVPVLSDFFDGQDCLLLAYGVTNSGKTYTITGTSEEPGILPRTLDVVFNSIQCCSDVQFKPKCYSEVLYLNDTEQEQELIFKQDLLRKVFRESSIATSELYTSAQSSTNISDVNSVSGLSEETCSLGASVLGEIDIHEDYVIPVDTQNGKLHFSIFVSYAEIYNDFIYDLLDEKPVPGKLRHTLKLSADKNGNPYIKGLHEVKVNSAKEAFQLLRVGLSHRHVAGTCLNYHSSRSHSIYTIKVVKFVAGIKRPNIARVNRLSIVDLAGSERSKKTGAKGERIKEAGSINTSLLTLGRCIEAMRHNQNALKRKDIKVVPFRESKLTQLLQSYFVGRAINREGRIVMFVNVADGRSVFSETYHVLKFSALASEVVPVTKSSSVQKDSLISYNESFAAETCQNCSHYAQQLELQGNQFKKELAQLKLELWEKECTVRSQVSLEYNKQVVEIEERCNREMEEHELLMEEELERRLVVAKKSLKKQYTSRKRVRTDVDSDVHLEESNEINYMREEYFQLKQKLDEKNEELEMERNKAVCERQDLASTYENNIANLQKQFNALTVKYKEDKVKTEEHTKYLEVELKKKSEEILSLHEKLSQVELNKPSEPNTDQAIEECEKENEKLLLRVIELESFHGLLHVRDVANVSVQTDFSECDEELCIELAAVVKELHESQNAVLRLNNEKDQIASEVEIVKTENDIIQRKLRKECDDLMQSKIDLEMEVVSLQKDNDQLQTDINSEIQSLKDKLLKSEMNNKEIKCQMEKEMDEVLEAYKTQLFDCQSSELNYKRLCTDKDNQILQLKLRLEQMDTESLQFKERGKILQTSAACNIIEGQSIPETHLNSSQNIYDIPPKEPIYDEIEIVNEEGNLQKQCTHEELNETGRCLATLDRSSQLIEDSFEDFDISKPIINFNPLKDAQKKKPPKTKKNALKWKNEEAPIKTDVSTPSFSYNLRTRKVKTASAHEGDENLSPIMKIKNFVKVPTTGKKKRVLSKSQISAPLDSIP